MTMSVYTAATTLFLVMDPIGNTPIFSSLLKSVDPKRRSYVILRETLIALVVLAIFLFCGQAILDGLQATPAALSIAGGIILFLISLKMIFPPDISTKAEKKRGEPLIVPLAVPLVAGPSAMATVMLFASRDPSMMMRWFFALVIAWFVSTLILLSSTKLSKLLGEKGLIALERLMGMVLTILSVQMFLTGVSQYFKL